GPGKPCRGAAMPNGRCKLHGGKSTGPRTAEIERLMAAARKSSRYGHRDATMIPDWLSAWLAGVRVVRSAMGAGRARHRPATRPQGEERLAECPPDAGRRDTRAATPAARTGAVLARLHDRARRAHDAQALPCAIPSHRRFAPHPIPAPSAPPPPS